jgi:hypothetical protein
MTPGADAAGCSRRTARSAALGAAARGPDGPVASECRGEEDVLEDSKETQAEEPEEAARRGHWKLCHCSDQCSVKCGPLEANRSQRRADWVDQSELASGHGWSVEIVVMALWSCDSVHCCGSYSTGSSPVAADPCESLADLCTGALPLTRSEVGCGCLCQSRGLVLPRARGWCERGSCGSMLASSQ